MQILLVVVLIQWTVMSKTARVSEMLEYPRRHDKVVYVKGKEKVVVGLCSGKKSFLSDAISNSDPWHLFLKLQALATSTKVFQRCLFQTSCQLDMYQQWSYKPCLHSTFITWTTFAFKAHTVAVLWSVENYLEYVKEMSVHSFKVTGLLKFSMIPSPSHLKTGAFRQHVSMQIT